MTVAAVPSSDLELLREHLAGSRDAFTQLVGRHVDMVYSAALRQARDPHLAEDITQAVFLLLWQKAATLNDGVLLAGWLHRSTRYCAANALRLRSIRHHHEQRAATMTPRVNESRDASAFEQAELASVVDQAVEQLGATDRAAVIMRYFGGKSVHDVAAALNVTPEAARKRIDRALDKLQTIVKRLGVTTATPALVAFLTTHSLHTAPAHVASSIATTLAAASTGSAASVGAAGTIAKKALVAMSAKTKITAIAAAIALLLAGSAVVYKTTSAPAAERPALAVVATSRPANKIRIQAYIDGRSRLEIRGNTLQWHHEEFNVPGNLGATTRPTIVNGKQWFPNWLGVGIGRAVNVSDVYDKLDPPLPTPPGSFTFKPIKARGKIAMQPPMPENNYTLTAHFDDGPEPGADLYILEITFQPEAAWTPTSRPAHPYADGSVHRGEMKNGQRDGKGEMTWATGARKGDKYDGEWKTDQPDGTGVYTSADGSRYEGEFKKGVRDGKGSIIWTSGAHKGDRYAGEWKAGKMDGTGTLNYADGSEFRGEFHADVREGKGAMLWATGPRKGQKYEGEWRADQPDGAGEYTKGDGSTYRGIPAATRSTASNAR